MATDGISGAAKAAIDAGVQQSQNNPAVTLVIAGIVAYLIYAKVETKWPFKG